MVSGSTTNGANARLPMDGAVPTTRTSLLEVPRVVAICFALYKWPPITRSQASSILLKNIQAKHSTLSFAHLLYSMQGLPSAFERNTKPDKLAKTE